MDYQTSFVLAVADPSIIQTDANALLSGFTARGAQIPPCNIDVSRIVVQSIYKYPFFICLRGARLLRFPARFISTIPAARKFLSVGVSTWCKTEWSTGLLRNSHIACRNPVPSTVISRLLLPHENATARATRQTEATKPTNIWNLQVRQRTLGSLFKTYRYYVNLRLTGKSVIISLDFRYRNE